MNAKRLILSALITGLLVWAMSEFFFWILADLIGAGSISRIAPGLAGAVIGLTMSALRQAIQKKREEMLGGQDQST